MSDSMIVCKHMQTNIATTDLLISAGLILRRFNLIHTTGIYWQTSQYGSNILQSNYRIVVERKHSCEVLLIGGISEIKINVSHNCFGLILFISNNDILLIKTLNWQYDKFYTVKGMLRSYGTIVILMHKKSIM